MKAVTHRNSEVDSSNFMDCFLLLHPVIKNAESMMITDKIFFMDIDF
jgi:hypothetical protein